MNCKIETETNQMKNLLFMYNSAIKIVNTKIDILNDSYKNLEYNPIENVKSRLKTQESIYDKLKRRELPISSISAKENLEDIAGVRIICAFSKDIYELAEIIKKQDDIKFIRESDYINNPKPSGYRSYHMVVEVPIYVPDGVENVKVEIQIRTKAMDFWACLEHKARYKFNGNVPEHLGKEFKVCADKIAELDERMFLIHDIIKLINN